MIFLSKVVHMTSTFPHERRTPRWSKTADHRQGPSGRGLFGQDIRGTHGGSGTWTVSLPIQSTTRQGCAYRETQNREHVGNKMRND